VFSSLAGNGYMAVVVAKEFLDGGAWSAGLWGVNVPQLQSMQDHIGSLQHLDTIACIKTYSSQFVSDHLNVLLVTNISNSTNSFLDAYEHAPDSFDNFGWMCGGPYTDSSAICTTAAVLSMLRTGKLATQTGLCNIALASRSKITANWRSALASQW
jgi:hypothetical protein